MECISEAKIPPSGETSVCYNSVSQNAITDIQIVILTNTQKIVENFYGIKLGLNKFHNLALQKRGSNSTTDIAVT